MMSYHRLYPDAAVLCQGKAFLKFLAGIAYSAHYADLTADYSAEIRGYRLVKKPGYGIEAVLFP